MKSKNNKTNEHQILKVKDLSKSFTDGNAVFENIDFSVSSGEFIAILGPSGCGKTTLLHIIAHLLKPTSGTVRFFDNDDFEKSTKAKLIFQEYNKSLFPWKTVFENVGFVLKNTPPSSEEREKRVRKYLELVGLEEAFNKYPWQLSGGMQQRVAIARALATEPKVLLMDEPFGSLDANIRRELEIELLEIWKKLKITILFVTHDIDEAIFLSNFIFIMKGSPSKIIKKLYIDISYPRDYLKTRNSKNFGEYRSIILKCFQ